MASRLETHAWYDGQAWSVCSERAADIARFTKWWGKPSRMGRDGSVAHWDSLSPDVIRLARRRKGRVSPNAAKALTAFREGKKAEGTLGHP
jgi:hypothetical protein